MGMRGVRRPDFTEEVIAKILKLYVEDNLTQRDIAVRFNSSVYKVSRVILARLGRGAVENNHCKGFYR